MPYILDEVNSAIRSDAAAFIAECDELYDKKIALAANKMAENLPSSPLVLLSGPSSSGKTTTAAKLALALARHGIKAHSLSMDDYFIDVCQTTAPRNDKGEMDFESPLCLDMELLHRHFELLESGEEIQVPRFDFRLQRRDASTAAPLKLGDNEIVIIEGIHALSDMITNQHSNALKLYISADSHFMKGSNVCFDKVWLRLVRRCVRDSLFRGAGVDFTLDIWNNVRRGEKLYIRPFKFKANVLIDSVLPYEISAMKRFAMDAFGAAGKPWEILKEILPSLELFEEFDPELVPDTSLIREFIGGGVFGKH